MSQERQSLFYIGCNACSTKINTDIGTKYPCTRCGKEVIATLILIVIMLVVDQTDVIRVVAIDNVAERILQTSAEQLTSIIDKGTEYELQSIQNDFIEKTFMMLRRSFSGGQKNQRRAVLISYFKDNRTAFPAKSIAIDKPATSITNIHSEFPSSPLRRQLSRIAINPESPSKRKIISDVDDNASSSTTASEDQPTAENINEEN